MTEINMLEAKTNLTKLVRMLETNQEDEFIICRNGEPCAKLVFYEKKKTKRKVGMYDGLYKLPTWEEWKQMDEEIIKDIEEGMEDLEL